MTRFLIEFGDDDAFMNVPLLGDSEEAVNSIEADDKGEDEEKIGALKIKSREIEAIGLGRHRVPDKFELQLLALKEIAQDAGQNRSNTRRDAVDESIRRQKHSRLSLGCGL